MVSRPETILAVKKARKFELSGIPREPIAKKLGVSVKRVNEYLERNRHQLSCPSCGGYGINKQRSTGIKGPICNR